MKVEALIFVSHPAFPTEEGCSGAGEREGGSMFGKEKSFTCPKTRMWLKGACVAGSPCFLLA